MRLSHTKTFCRLRFDPTHIRDTIGRKLHAIVLFKRKIKTKNKEIMKQNQQELVKYKPKLYEYSLLTKYYILTLVIAMKLHNTEKNV